MSSAAERQWSVVVCEGYHDRAFWKGLLLHLGCTDPSSRGRVRLQDPWGDPVVGGHFGFRSCSGRFIVIVPSRGERDKGDKIKSTASFYLEQRPKKRIDRLVINVDDDAPAGSPGQAASHRSSFSDVIRKIDPAVQVLPNGDLELSDGCVVSIVVWSSANTPLQGGVPGHENLERLVCAAIAAAHPPQVQPVADFLSSAGHTRPRADAKAHAWSYMARLWPEDGCERFFEHVWEDPAVSQGLFAIPIDAWRVARELAG
jgi:hypothetical protein